jgi:hypothetical protein
VKEGLESLGRLRVQGLVLLAIVFGVGLFSGVAGDRMLRRQRRSSFPPLPPRGASAADLPFYFERLALSSDQRARITGILRGSRPVTDSIMESTLPRLRTVMDSVRQEIREVLTAEQRSQLDSLLPPGRFRDGFRPAPPAMPGPRETPRP